MPARTPPGEAARDPTADRYPARRAPRCVPRRAGKPSVRRESPTATSTVAPSATSRATAMRQAAASVSCPASRTAPRACAAVSRPPVPQAGSRTVRPETAARSVTSSVRTSGVAGTRRAVASRNRPIKKRRTARGSPSAPIAPTRRSTVISTGSIDAGATVGSSGAMDESASLSTPGNSLSVVAFSLVHSCGFRVSSTTRPPRQPTAAVSPRSSTWLRRSCHTRSSGVISAARPCVRSQPSMSARR